MKIAPLAAFAFLMALSAMPAFQPEVRVCRGFLPENDMKIPVGDVMAAGIAEARFNAVIDRAEAVYRPVFARRGVRLQVDRNWEDGTVNAYAMQSGGVWKVAMFGGLARHPAITEEGFALVVCHEIGHHIGGFPRKGNTSWATNEGGADYFATLKCLRRVLPPSSLRRSTDPFLARACDSAWRDNSARAQCRAGAMAGMSTALMFQSFRSVATPRFDTPDPDVVQTMADHHPQPQCRLDTYFQGALCTKPVGEDVSNSDANAGTCTRRNGHAAGLRPHCWYKPPQNEPASPVRRRLDLVGSDKLEKRLGELAGALNGA